MFVRDVMTREPVTVTEDCAIKQAVTVLAGRHISALPVVDGRGRLCGVVSEADLIRDAFPTDPRSHIWSHGDDFHTRPKSVSEVMTPHAVTLHESADLADAAELMTSTTVKSVPVIDDNGRLVGVLSRSDLVRVSARTDQDLEQEIDALLVTLGHTDWLVEALDGVVTIDGPSTAEDRSLAEVAARTVAGVVAVEVR